MKIEPKQKCPKDHEVFCDGYSKDDWKGKGLHFCDESSLCYLRKGARAHIKETPTTEKIRNLLLFADWARGDPDCVDPEEFCEMRGISISNFRRLLTILREHYGICSESGNAYEDTPANRRYLALLTLYDWLEDGVDMQAFCSEFHIGRTTFFRYLALVEDFYIYVYEGEKRIALLGDGRYVVVRPVDLEDYNAWEDRMREWKREERMEKRRKNFEAPKDESDGSVPVQDEGF